MKKILLITGWGVGVAALHRLKTALEQQHQVKLINIFDAHDPIQLQQHLDLAQHYDVLIGWSLGGQLAALLAQGLYQQYGQLKVLMTLASHPCFTSDDPALFAMLPQTFAQFKQSYLDHPEQCIKQFSFMLTQAAAEQRLLHKQNWRKLQDLIEVQPHSLLLKGLDLLEKLNLVEILQNYAGPQWHCFARQDALVNYQVSTLSAYLVANLTNFELIEGSHAFPFLQAEYCAEKILAKIKQT